MKENIELLAPVGSMEALYAAVQNGANAVYLGGKLFNARQYASNFDYEELKDAVSYAHLNNVKVYITVNILIDNEEMKEILDYIKFLYEIDIDAIIVQDLGLASLVRKSFPDLNLHASTQMTINNLWGARYLEEMGFTRVVLARETPIEEIKKIKENTSIELEGFIHGALCVSYSGQCLMSSMIGGRSGNRGKCAQPCRMSYSIVNRDGKLVKDWDKKHVLSTRDLNTIDHLDKIISSGISSLKIEGRVKRPEYVATIVKNYRNAIDKGTNSIDKQAKEDIRQIFNREFTKGLGLEDFGRDYIASDRPDNRGILLGRVVRADKYKVDIELEEDLDKDDGIEFLLSNGDYRGMRSPIEARKGSLISLEKPGYINIDSLVYRTSSVKLLEKSRISYEENQKKYPVDMEVTIKIGEKPSLNLIFKNHKISTTIDKKVEEAKSLPLDTNRLEDQLSKLGDSVYYLNNFIAEIEDGTFLPLSSINELRRKAVEDLDKILKNKNTRKDLNPDKYLALKKDLLALPTNKTQENKKLHIRVSNLEQFNQLDLNKLDRIYLGYTEGLEDSIDKILGKGKEVYLWTEKILYGHNLDKLEKTLRPLKDKIKGLAVLNLGPYKFIKDRFDLQIHGDMGLNIFNSYSIRHLKNEGVTSMTLSPELNLKQIKKIGRLEDSLEAIVYGYLPVMVSKTCPMALVKGCKDDSSCETCSFAKGYGLKDRMNITFKMFRGDGFTNIYNSVPLMALDNIKPIFDSGISNLRLDFTFEIENIKNIQSAFYDYMHDSMKEDDMKGFMEEFRERTNITNGHYFRGVI